MTQNNQLNTEELLEKLAVKVFEHTDIRLAQHLEQIQHMFGHTTEQMPQQHYHKASLQAQQPHVVQPPTTHHPEQPSQQLNVQAPQYHPQETAHNYPPHRGSPLKKKAKAHQPGKVHTAIASHLFSNN